MSNRFDSTAMMMNMRQSLISLVVALLVASLEVTSFVTVPKAARFQSNHAYHRQTSYSSSSYLSSTPTSNSNDYDQREPIDDYQKQQQNDNEEDLSDLDARVLRTMLTDGSLDLLTEDDMLKLLDRASTGSKDSSQLPPINTMQHQYRVAAYQPVDMFPHTHHVENVLLLERIG